MMRPARVVKRLLGWFAGGRLVTRGSARGDAVYLTFDDGPHPQHTAAILSILRQHRVRATFFFVGSLAERYPQLVRQALAEGHVVASHGYDHLSPDEAPGRAYIDNVTRGHEALERVAERTLPRWFRPPYGELGLGNLLRLWRQGFRVVLWNVDSDDSSGGVEAPAVVERLTVGQVGAGDIVLLHDDTAATSEALPDVLEALRASGLRVCSLADGALPAHVRDVARAVAPIRPGGLMAAETKRFAGRLALVGEFPPPAAGMTVQAQMLVRRLTSAGVAVRAVRTNAALPEWLERLPLLRGGLKWLRFLYSCRALWHVDVVHVFACSGLSFVLFALPPVALGRLLRKGVVLHYHGGAAEGFARRHPRLLEWTLARVDRLVVPSGFLQQVFERLGYGSEVIGNPTDLRAFRFIAPAPRDPVVLSCRNLEPVYDVGTAIRAFATVHERLPAARLVVAGEGSQRLVLERLVLGLGLGDVVEFVGNVPNERMPELLASATVVLNASLADNLPGSILEAFASGVPVVSTDAGGIPWMMEDGVSGLLAPVGDSTALAAQVLRLVDDEGLAGSLAVQGRQVAESLSWDRIGPRWQGVYCELSRRRAA